jgi:hypothetical protein
LPIQQVCVCIAGREREIQIESRSGREEGQWCWRVVGMGMGA